MSAHTLLQMQAGRLHGRQMTMIVTIALHALVIAGLMAMRVMPAITVPDFIAPIDLPPADRTVPPEPPEPTVDKRFLPPTITPDTFDPPEPIIRFEESNENAALPPTDSGPAADAAEGPGTNAIPQIPPTALQFRAVRPADDYYPSQSLTLQEQGTAIVRVCVAPSGKLDGKPAIESTSGSPRLDAAALTWAREALRFTPATQGGVAIGACKGFRVNFQLH